LILPSQAINVPTANSFALRVLDRVLDEVSDRVSDGVLDEVSDEVPYGGSDCKFALLHTDHALNPYNHQIELNLAQNHRETSITHT
jgi:hypothetical protein